MIGPLVRCARCRLYLPTCMCAALRSAPARTRVVVLMARSELKKPTNTGRLVPLLLDGSSVRLRGATGPAGVEAASAPRGRAGAPAPGTSPGAPLDVSDLLADPARAVALLDPTGRVTLDAFAAADPRPLTLLVPDGTWRQARRLSRLPGLEGVRRVRLPAGDPTRYRLRDGGAPERLATLEAVARALGLLEGPEVQARLEAVFDLMVERTLWLRGAPPPARDGPPERASAR